SGMKETLRDLSYRSWRMTVILILKIKVAFISVVPLATIILVSAVSLVAIFLVDGTGRYRILRTPDRPRRDPGPLQRATSNGTSENHILKNHKITKLARRRVDFRRA